MKAPLYLLLLCGLVLVTYALPLEKWDLIDSTKLSPPYNTGSSISIPTYDTSKWYKVTTPATVLAGLLQNNLYTNPFYSVNLQNISSSQFDSPWWYRATFRLNPAPQKNVTVTLHGINYSANVWVNGVLVESNTNIIGAFRRFDIDITRHVEENNAIALQIFRPHDRALPENKDVDLSLSFIDWAPPPPDDNMGIWRDAIVSVTGPVSLRHPMVRTELTLSGSTPTAHLFVLLELENHLPTAAHGSLQIQITPPTNKVSPITLKQAVTLKSQEVSRVTFNNVTYKELNIAGEYLWWPWQMGLQPLYNLSATFYTDNGESSDSISVQFGVRQVTSELDKNGHRLYRVNGKRILIRGAGWAPELFQRVDLDKQESEFKYVRHMGLNTIRLEGHLAQDSFYDMANKYGILLMPGWSCCDAWQHWSSWGPTQHTIAQESLRSQLKRLRIHPSILVFLYSSDELPPVTVEREYLSVINDELWPNPVLSSASADTSTISGPSGVKMSGPYSWVPPNYWELDTRRVGGAFGFLTEGGPGEAPLTLESFARTVPSNHQWPMDSYWDFHCGNPLGVFKDLRFFTSPLYARYGTANSAADYLQKSQVAIYEGIRAMFEGYSRNKYTTATGVIQWMLNNPWPEMIWHLYDFYLNPPAAYFATKKACEAIHPQYSYDDSSVWIVNSEYIPHSNLLIIAEVYNLDGTVVYNSSVRVATVDADSSLKLFVLPQFKNVSSTSYFVFLHLLNSSNGIISDNVYWLSTKQDVLDWSKSTFYNTACTSYADFTALQKLGRVNVEVSSNIRKENEDSIIDVTLSNPSRTTIAFFIRLRVTEGSGDDVAPIFWDDNYVTLPPLRKKIVSGRFKTVPNPRLVVEVFNNISGGK